MLVANSFDLWQKDSFFSAAEEVQASADIMESAFRTWLRHKRGGVAPQHFDEVCRELQAALGTAKWQLDEFDGAVRLSYRKHTDDITTTRHQQFVSAIGNQISLVEAALRESFHEEGKRPLRWVNLDEEERDDLAVFLSGSSSHPAKNMMVGPSNIGTERESGVPEKQFLRNDLDFGTEEATKIDVPNELKGCKDAKSNSDGKYVIEMEPNDLPGTSDGSSGQADRKRGTRKTWSSPNVGALKIMLQREDEQKDKKSKPFIWKPWRGDCPQEKGGTLSYTQLRVKYWINELFRHTTGSQRQVQTSMQLQRSCSFRLMLTLVLTIILLVPFVFYSN